MFYRADDPHGLAHDPFKAIIAPRPIGWISSQDKDGRVNLAPYSFFNAVCDNPKILMFSSGGMKDSATNAQETKEFTFNFVSRSMKDVMNVTSTSFPKGENEFDKANLEMISGTTVSCPRVKGVAAAFECKVLDVITPTLLDGAKAPYSMVLGQVSGVYIDDAMITEDGRFDTMKADPILRAGYHDYVCLDELFELPRPE
ncbi:MAG: flavin reductase family protein [Rhizobiaceae bacterium]